MKIEQWKTSKVKPYERNPRNNDAAVEAVAKSIREFGFRVPIVVDANGVIIAGHTRLKAAIKLELAEVPVHVAKDLSPAQVKALRIADNKLHELASWDQDSLRLELEDLLGAGFDMSIMGFGDDLEAAMAVPNAGLVDPDDVPAPPDKATTVKGDIWVLGNHRLMCGDSSKPEDLDRLLDGESMHLVNTDPPYNVAAQSRSVRSFASGTSSALPNLSKSGPRKSPMGQMRSKDRPIANDCMTAEKYDETLLEWFGNIARALKPGHAFYIWGGYGNTKNYRVALEAVDLFFHQSIIWWKNHRVLGRKDFMSDHEWCFYGWKQGGGAPVLRAEQRRRRVASQEGQRPGDGASDREARRAGQARDGVLEQAGGERPGSFRRVRVDAHRRGDDRAARVPDGARRALLRRHRRPLGAVHGQKGASDRGNSGQIHPETPFQISQKPRPGALTAGQEGG